MHTRILVVEDDQDIAELVARYLDKAGFVTERATSGREALKTIAARPPDLMVLDLMLPHVDGLEVCRVVRGNEASSAPTPIWSSRSARTSSSRGCARSSAARNEAPDRRRRRSPTAPSRSIPSGTSCRSTAAM